MAARRQAVGPAHEGPLTAVEQALGPYPTPSLRFRELVGAYAWLNPHLTLRGVFFGREFVNVVATRPDWEKWRPRNPTSAHWYDEARLQRYLAAHVARDRELGQSRTVRAFIAEFRGLSGTAVQRRVLTGAAVRINPWPVFSASTGSTKVASLSCSRR